MMKDVIDRIYERIDSAAKKAGRSAGSVRLMAVTKTKPTEEILKAYDAGLRLFGENRVQEAAVKYADFPEDSELHLIGHLQRNKAKIAAGLFTCVQSIDKEETAAALNRYCAEAGKFIDILLEVNTSGETTKSGFLSQRDVFTFLETLDAYSHLKLRGLMTVGPLSTDENQVRSSFKSLKNLFDTISSQMSALKMDTLSMGMSSDFEIAVEEGSTMVRIGTMLFGERPSL